MKTRTSLFSLAFALTLAAAPVFAQDASDKKDDQKLDGSVTIGGQDGTGIDDSSKLQQYETVPKGVTVFDASIDWTKNKDYVKFDGRMLGQDDQYSLFQIGRKQAWSFNLGLNENPRWFSNVARTPYYEQSPGVFRLPDGMRQNLQRIWSPATTDPAAPANSSDNRFWSLRDYILGAQPVDLRYVRRDGSIAFNVTALENWTFKASYNQDNRDGHQPVSFTAGPGIDEVANPVKYTTKDTRGEIEFDKGKLFVNAAFTYSTFHNDVPYTYVDNPVRYDNTDFSWTGTSVINTAANATARLWNAPDNKATSFDVSGGYLFPAHNKLTFTASEIVMTNDYNLVAQALNPNLNLATTSADYGKFSLKPEYATYNGKLNQTNFNVTFTGDPSPKFGYSVMYRTFDLADKAPSYTFHSTVNSDGGASYSATGTTTDDVSFDTKQYKAEVHVSPVTGFRLGAYVSGNNATYEEREFAEVKDTTVGVTADANMHWGMFHGSFGSMSRTPSTWIPANSTATDPGSRMKDTAQQDAKIWNATLTLTPIDKISLALFTSGSKADFPSTRIGLKKNDMTAGGLDFIVAPNKSVMFDVAYVYESINMKSDFWYSANGSSTVTATNTTDQYFNSIRDKANTAKVGIRLTLVPDLLDLNSDFDYSRGTSESDFNIVAGGANAGGDLLFPTNTTTVNFAQGQYLAMPFVYNNTTIWKTWIDYHVARKVTLSFLYWRQKFEQADYAYDNLAPYFLTGSALYATTPGAVANIYPTLDPSANRALFLGASQPNFTANIFRASLTVRF